jgi:hypothetical protein
MKTPKDLTREELVACLTEVQQAMYLIHDSTLHGFQWDPDKERNPDTTAEVSLALWNRGLTPGELTPLLRPILEEDDS